jgi:hypothetical protein
MTSRVKQRLVLLDFDIENRPLTYLGMDFTTSDITAIAASFGVRKPCPVWLLGRDPILDMLNGFVAMYDEADIVTGHYIRKHDLPIITGALMEYGLPILKPKLTSDTKMDLLRRGGISASQESLAGMLNVKAPKVHMTQTDWRRANRLEQVELAEKRCVGDVRQHQRMRLAMIRAGMLGPPKLWRP